MKIDFEEVLNYLGISDGNPENAEIDKINQVIQLVKDSCKPKCVYKIVDADLLNLSGKDIRIHLNNATKVVIMACTCGFETDMLISRLQLKDMAKAVIADAAASVAVESICDDLENEIRSQVEKDGRFLTGRFSPGYGDLPLSVSRQLIDILGSENRIGLGIMESGLLSPIKSVTAILGILNEKIPGISEKCLKCSKRATCNFRKK